MFTPPADSGPHSRRPCATNAVGKPRSISLVSRIAIAYTFAVAEAPRVCDRLYLILINSSGRLASPRAAGRLLTAARRRRSCDRWGAAMMSNKRIDPLLSFKGSSSQNQISLAALVENLSAVMQTDRDMLHLQGRNALVFSALLVEIPGRRTRSRRIAALEKNF